MGIMGWVSQAAAESASTSSRIRYAQSAPPGHAIPPHQNRWLPPGSVHKAGERARPAWHTPARWGQVESCAIHMQQVPGFQMSNNISHLVGTDIQCPRQALNRRALPMELALLDMFEGIFAKDTLCHLTRTLPTPKWAAVRPK